MDTRIIAKVSELVLERRLGVKLPEKRILNKSKSDTVQISPAASDAMRIRSAMNNEDANRAERVAKLKTEIRSNGFRLTDEMVEQIAGNIASILI